jgi:hypothetical protein
MAVVVDAAVRTIALAGGMHQRESARAALGKETPLDRGRSRLGMTRADEAGGDEGPAVFDEGGSFTGGDDLHGERGWK